MVQPKVYEGTWEELSSHAEEFRDLPKLTLIVPATAENGIEINGKSEPTVTLAERLKGRVGLFNFGGANLSEDTGRKFTELLGNCLATATGSGHPRKTDSRAARRFLPCLPNDDR